MRKLLWNAAAMSVPKCQPSGINTKCVKRTLKVCFFRLGASFRNFFIKPIGSDLHNIVKFRLFGFFSMPVASPCRL
uniref:Uncharacterized protein n=1 Tax=Anguilla anguilla TaxID=7936 RepID=A0A0E9UAW8_ANGAN